MTKMWAVNATIRRRVDGWDVSRQVPIFYLHPTVQGIVSADQAERIARDVLSTFDPTAMADVYVVEVEL